VGFGQLLRSSLVAAQLRSNAVGIAVDALAVLVIVGRADRAVAYARLVRDPVRQSLIYGELAAVARSCSDWVRARDLLADAMAFVRAIDKPYLREEASANLAPICARLGDRGGLVQLREARTVRLLGRVRLTPLAHRN
jgi:hypothetical protein